MQKYDEYEKVEAFTGDYEQLQPGGYVCKITNVTIEDKDYGQLLRISFDIEEGEHKGFYGRLYSRKFETNASAKWGGMYYQTVKQDDLRYFKGMITAIENSNSGYKWSWDETTLKGKLFGALIGQEEYLGDDGRVKISTKIRFIRSVEQIRKGLDAPEIKRLSGSSKPAQNNFTSADNLDDDALPF